MHSLWYDLHNCHNIHRICGIGRSTSCSTIAFVSSTVICCTGASTKSRRVEPYASSQSSHEVAAGAPTREFEPVDGLVEHLQLFFLHLPVVLLLHIGTLSGEKTDIIVMFSSTEPC